MGPVQSKYQLPSGKRYIISYCKQYTNCSKIKESVNLENYIDPQIKTVLDLIYNVFYYKLDAIGYKIHHKYGQFQNINNSPLEYILKTVSIKSSNRDNLKDLDIKYICYFGTINNIQSLLSKGSILIAGIIIDLELSEFLGSKEQHIISDIVLLTGYSKDSFFIKTTWTIEILEIPNKYIENIKEIWDLFLNSPELS
jgi:hypothetical protein